MEIVPEKLFQGKTFAQRYDIVAFQARAFSRNRVNISTSTPPKILGTDQVAGEKHCVTEEYCRNLSIHCRFDFLTAPRVKIWEKKIKLL